ncbi:hypothetical protein HKX48_001421 [Thoreauomyces humboldtii]|nr:hypothetical protein HKX48_001421 [Thoreauomyces humboldtii]
MDNDYRASSNSANRIVASAGWGLAQPAKRGPDGWQQMLPEQPRVIPAGWSGSQTAPTQESRKSDVYTTSHHDRIVRKPSAPSLSAGNGGNWGLAPASEPSGWSAMPRGSDAGRSGWGMAERAGPPGPADWVPTSLLGSSSSSSLGPPVFHINPSNPATGWRSESQHRPGYQGASTSDLSGGWGQSVITPSTDTWTASAEVVDEHLASWSRSAPPAGQSTHSISQWDTPAPPASPQSSRSHGWSAEPIPLPAAKVQRIERIDVSAIAKAAADRESRNGWSSTGPASPKKSDAKATLSSTSTLPEPITSREPVVIRARLNSKEAARLPKKGEWSSSTGWNNDGPPVPSWGDVDPSAIPGGDNIGWNEKPRSNGWGAPSSSSSASSKAQDDWHTPRGLPPKPRPSVLSRDWNDRESPTHYQTQDDDDVPEEEISIPLSVLEQERDSMPIESVVKLSELMGDMLEDEGSLAQLAAVKAEELRSRNANARKPRQRPPPDVRRTRSTMTLTGAGDPTPVATSRGEDGRRRAATIGRTTAPPERENAHVDRATTGRQAGRVRGGRSHGNLKDIRYSVSPEKGQPRRNSKPPGLRVSSPTKAFSQSFETSKEMDDLPALPTLQRETSRNVHDASRIDIAQLPAGVRAGHIVDIFGAFGPLLEVFVSPGRFEEQEAHGHVNFEYPEHAAAAIEGIKDRTFFEMARPLDMSLCQSGQLRNGHVSRGSVDHQQIVAKTESVEYDYKTLHLPLLPMTVDKSALEKVFLAHGEITRIYVVQRAKEKRAYAFVSFSTSHAAKTALQSVKHKKLFGMNEITRVDFAHVADGGRRNTAGDVGSPVPPAVPSTSATHAAVATGRPSTRQERRSIAAASTGGDGATIVKVRIRDRTVEQTRRILGNIGPVAQVLPLEDTRDTPHFAALVRYEDADAADLAVRNRTCEAVFPRQRHLHVERVESDVDVATVRSFLETWGAVSKMSVYTPRGADRQCVDVEFMDGAGPAGVLVRMQKRDEPCCLGGAARAKYVTGPQEHRVDGEPRGLIRAAAVPVMDKAADDNDEDDEDAIEAAAVAEEEADRRERKVQEPVSPAGITSLGERRRTSSPIKLTGTLDEDIPTSPFSFPAAVVARPRSWVEVEGQAPSPSRRTRSRPHSTLLVDDHGDDEAATASVVVSALEKQLVAGLRVPSAQEEEEDVDSAGLDDQVDRLVGEDDDQELEDGVHEELEQQDVEEVEAVTIVDREKDDNDQVNSVPVEDEEEEDPKTQPTASPTSLSDDEEDDQSTRSTSSLLEGETESDKSNGELSLKTDEGQDARADAGDEVVVETAFPGAVAVDGEEKA